MYTNGDLPESFSTSSASPLDLWPLPRAWVLKVDTTVVDSKVPSMEGSYAGLTTRHGKSGSIHQLGLFINHVLPCFTMFYLVLPCFTMSCWVSYNSWLNLSDFWKAPRISSLQKKNSTLHDSDSKMIFPLKPLGTCPLPPLNPSAVWTGWRPSSAIFVRRNRLNHELRKEPPWRHGKCHAFMAWLWKDRNGKINILGIRVMLNWLSVGKAFFCSRYMFLQPPPLQK